MPSPSISACVITLNEEDNIERCLESVQWADEIVVVDSGSEDRTVEIADSLGANTFYNEWPGHRDQKQYATDRASHDWIFSLDADEKVSDELRDSVLETFAGDPPRPDTCFEIKRRSNYLGQWMTYGGWYPDRIIRLFNRKSTHWGGDDPHDYVVPTDTVRELSGDLLHWPYDDIEDQIQHSNSYSTAQAREKYEAGETGGILKGLSHGTFLFLRDYVLRLGFLEGRRGFMHCVHSAFYTYLKYVKLYEKEHF